MLNTRKDINIRLDARKQAAAAAAEYHLKDRVIGRLASLKSRIQRMLDSAGPYKKHAHSP
eukprot:1160831-Pelagomonas_calceolata.AAC.9